MKGNLPANVVNKHVKVEVIIGTVTVKCDFFTCSFSYYLHWSQVWKDLVKSMQMKFKLVSAYLLVF